MQREQAPEPVTLMIDTLLAHALRMEAKAAHLRNAATTLTEPYDFDGLDGPETAQHGDPVPSTLHFRWPAVVWEEPREASGDHEISLDDAVVEVARDEPEDDREWREHVPGEDPNVDTALEPIYAWVPYVADPEGSDTHDEPAHVTIGHVVSEQREGTITVDPPIASVPEPPAASPPGAPPAAPPEDSPDPQLDLPHQQSSRLGDALDALRAFDEAWVGQKAVGARMGITSAAASAHLLRLEKQGLAERRAGAGKAVEWRACSTPDARSAPEVRLPPPGKPADAPAPIGRGPAVLGGPSAATAMLPPTPDAPADTAEQRSEDHREQINLLPTAIPTLVRGKLHAPRADGATILGKVTHALGWRPMDLEEALQRLPDSESPRELVLYAFAHLWREEDIYLEEGVWRSHV